MIAARQARQNIGSSILQLPCAIKRPRTRDNQRGRRSVPKCHLAVILDLVSVRPKVRDCGHPGILDFTIRTPLSAHFAKHIAENYAIPRRDNSASRVLFDISSTSSPSGARIGYA